MKEIIPRQNQLDLLEFVCSICISQPSGKNRTERIYRDIQTEICCEVFAHVIMEAQEAHYLPSASWRPRKPRMKLQSKLKGLRARGANNIRPSLTPQKVRKDQYTSWSKSKGRPKNQKHQGLRVEEMAFRLKQELLFTFFVLFRPLDGSKLVMHWFPALGRVILFTQFKSKCQSPLETISHRCSRKSHFQLSGHLGPVKWT